MLRTRHAATGDRLATDTELTGQCRFAGAELAGWTNCETCAWLKDLLRQWHTPRFLARSMPSSWDDRPKAMPSVEFQAVGPDDWSLWRELRLRALADAPSAFGSTLADWTGPGETEQRRRERLSSVALNLVASLSAKPVGMASATSPVKDEVELISMWVAPEARGRGVGGVLVEAIALWALKQPVARVALDVRKANTEAVKLYQQHDFVDAGAHP